MIGDIFKFLASEKSRVTIQIGILGGMILGAFVAGSKFEKFSQSQAAIARGVETLLADRDVQRELLKSYERNAWTFGMQKDYTAELKALNPDLMIPNVSELKIKHDENK